MRTFAEAERILEQRLENYVHRPQQGKVAAFIEQCIADEAHGLVQAPVGVGKSLAALIPAVLSGKRVVVATATNILAEQYAQKDIPFLQENLGVDFTWSIVKGRSNYVCSWELHENGSESPVAQQIYQELRSNPAHSGDFDQFSFPIPREDRKLLSVSAKECPGLSNCSIGRKVGCFPHRAREQAQEAQIVLTNIASLLLNAKLDGRLLGHYDAIIIDEGHNLDQYTISSLAESINFTGLRDLVEKLSKALPDVDHASIRGAIDEVEKIAFQELSRNDNDKMVKIDHEWMLNHIDPWLPIFAGMSEYARRLDYLVDRATEAVEANGDGESSTIHYETIRNSSKLAKQAKGIIETLEMLMFNEHDSARWISSYEVNVPGRRRKMETRAMYNVSPIESAGFLRRHLWEGDESGEEEQAPMPPVILMSGTLAPGGNFGYIKSTLGAWKAREIRVESPFDYAKQALLYTPGKMIPAPNQFDEWLPWYCNTTKEMVKSSNGGALLLFTSRRAMEAAAEALMPYFKAKGYYVLIQDGEMSNSELGKLFNEHPDSILFALRSFFEGFDPRLGSCRAVVLDKLPFPVPTDVIFEARSNKIAEESGSTWASFQQLSIPMMSLVLEQAMGRLIRSDKHQGLMAIMDSRLNSKGYGRSILNSLPPARRTDRAKEALGFLKNI